jgi:hypothetical protein
MRRLVLVLIVLLGIVLAAAYYPAVVERPLRDGAGPLAIRLPAGVPAPEYHSPLTWWQTHHMDSVNNGDFVQADCLYCHEPASSCNNCHDYVGVAEVVP